MKELYKELQTKCTSSKIGFMGVNLDGTKTKDDLIENVKDEILVIESALEYSDVEEEYGMTEREAKGYVTKLKNFIKKHDDNG